MDKDFLKKLPKWAEEYKSSGVGVLSFRDKAFLGALYKRYSDEMAKFMREMEGFFRGSPNEKFVGEGVKIVSDIAYLLRAVMGDLDQPATEEQLKELFSSISQYDAILNFLLTEREKSNDLRRYLDVLSKQHGFSLVEAKKFRGTSTKVLSSLGREAKPEGVGGIFKSVMKSDVVSGVGAGAKTAAQIALGPVGGLVNVGLGVGKFFKQRRDLRIARQEAELAGSLGMAHRGTSRADLGGVRDC